MMRGLISQVCVFSILLQGFYLIQAEETIGSLFSNWMKEHKKVYRNEREHEYRLLNFKESVQMVKEHNALNSSYTLGLNHFADMSWEEFKATHLLSTPQNCSATKGNYKLGNYAIPTAVDWRKKGVVSGIKNQGACGSCWTFSTTGAMEAHVAITYNQHLNLSEQQLVDCAQAFNNHGCSGGLPSQAFEYIHYNDGLMTEDDYPYTAKDGKCKFDRSKAKAFVGRVMNITQYDEASLVEAIALAGPVSIAYQVAKDFRLYKDGVYSSKVCQSTPDEVNHAVLAVGYDVTDTGVPYYIVKNSWGTKFGINGYFWIERGRNMCGLADCASYPVVTNQ